MSAPVLAANAVLDNEFVRAGVNETTGTFGSGGNTSPGLLYDSTGSGTFNTSYDYLTPGSPFDGFSVKVDGSNYDNNNTGITSIPSVGGLTVSSDGNTVTWNGAFTHATTSWAVENTYRLPDATPYIDITTRITAGSAASSVWFGRFIDPDARAAAGDSSVTDNVLGYGVIPTNNVAFSEALSSRYALGLYSTDANVAAGIQGWTREADGYTASMYGANYGRGDDTIGLSWVWSGVSAGDILTANYAYIFGPSAFGAASAAVAGGAGGGDTSVLTGSLSDVGSATDSASTPSTPPAPTLIGTSDPYTDVASYSVWTAWSRNTGLPVLTASVTHHTASDNGVIQTIDREVTTTTTTPELRTRTYNIIETETYSDSSTVNNILSTETETDLRNRVTLAVTDPGSFTGRIDQIATARDIKSSVIRDFDFDGVKLIGINSKYDNRMSGDTNGVSVGGHRSLDNGVILGAGIAGFNTRISQAQDTATADTAVLGFSVAKQFSKGLLEAKLKKASTDYLAHRVIGDFSNNATTTETDTSISLMFTGDVSDVVKPIVGVTRGRLNQSGFTETGSIQSARTVAAIDTDYEYVTLGAKFVVGPFNALVLHHTDGVGKFQVGIAKDTGRVTYSVTAGKTFTDQGNNTTVTAGLNVKF